MKRLSRGYHVVRRSERFSGDLITALVNEQVLMRRWKSVGEMIYNRGMADLQRSLWQLSTPVCTEQTDVNRVMHNVAGILFERNEQHKQATKAK